MTDEAPKRRRWWWFVLVAACGAVGIYLAAPDPESLRAAKARLADVPFATIAIIVGGAIGIVITEAIRIAAIARLVGTRVPGRDAWDAAVANHVMTAITPQVGLGEPTVAYLLNKRGTPWDAAVAIPFVKFMTSLALVFAIGTLLVAIGYGPAGYTTVGIVWFGIVAALSVLILGVCARPAWGKEFVQRTSRWLSGMRWFREPRWQDRIANATGIAERMLDRLAGLRRTSWRGALVLLVVHVIYYLSYVAPLVGLALVLGDPPIAPLVARSLVYLCFVFAMPTPGGSGPAEAVAVLFFGDLIGPTDAIIAVVVFRAATFYLQVAIGVIYLPLAALLRQDTSRR